MMRLTEAQRKALKWFALNGPASSFRCDGSEPSLRFVKRLEKLGFVERVGKERGAGLGGFGFTKFAISDAGRSALDKESET
jgi:hypothetical protein